MKGTRASRECLHSLHWHGLWSRKAYDFPGRLRYQRFSEDCRSLLEHLLLGHPGACIFPGMTCAVKRRCTRLHEEPEMRPTAAEAELIHHQTC